jgi:hypothetical protein
MCEEYIKYSQTKLYVYRFVKNVLLITSQATSFGS